MTNAKLTQDELQAIKDRAEKATEGQWVIDDGIMRADFEGDEIFDYSCGVNEHNNANFIANARQDIPKLVAEVERLQALADFEVKCTIKANRENARLREALREIIQRADDSPYEVVQIAEEALE